MSAKKTLQQRENELRSLLANPAGRKELQELECRYREASGKLKPAKTSVITYILVHERERGLISGSLPRTSGVQAQRAGWFANNVKAVWASFPLKS